MRISNLSLLLLFPAFTLIAAEPSSKKPPHPPLPKEPDHGFYIKAEAGAFIPTQMHVSAPESYWLTTIQGYNDNIGARPVVSAGLGYEFCPLIDFDAMLSYRPQFKYRKFQTASSESLLDGDQRLRKFDLDITSAMFTLYVTALPLNAKA